MKDVPEHIIERQLGLFAQVDPEYAKGVWAAIDALQPGPVAGG
jgi:catalase